MKTIFFVLCLVLVSFSAFSQKKHKLKAYLDQKTFFSPETGSYVEVHLQFVAYTLNFKSFHDSLDQQGLQSEIGVQYIIRQGDKVMKSDAYRLRSPFMRDSIIEDFYEIKRIPLDPGKYSLELTLTDLYGGNEAVTTFLDLDIADYRDKMSLSNIETAEVIVPVKNESIFTKSGYDIIPRISNYYSTQAENIPVYLEVYAPKTADKNVFGLKQSILDQKTKTELESFTRFSKVEVDQVQPVIKVIDISKLPSGEYILQFSLMDRENKELSTTEYFFERFTEMEYEPVTTENIVLDPNFQASITDDSLAYFVESLIPISKPAEIKNIITLLKTKDKALYRKYIQSYWYNSTGGTRVYDNWMTYKTQVWMVERLFSTNYTAGFETDRGRVYLQYGPPSNVITRENSPSDYPYEIWRYDKIKNFSNKRFVFYNPDLVNNTYRLLHSDMQGEMQNYRWQQQLAKRNSTNSNIDDPNDGNTKHFGGNSQQLYNQY
jgi:GWxTD domain-containing protein